MKSGNRMTHVTDAKMAIETGIEDVEKKEHYNIWVKGFETLKSEFHIVIDKFSANPPYRDEDFAMKIIEYGMLPFEKYIEICSGKKATKTRLFTIERSFLGKDESFLFFFRHSARRELSPTELNPVALSIARQNDDGYSLLKDESIKLREIGLYKTELIFFNDKEQIKDKSINDILTDFVVDILIIP